MTDTKIPTESEIRKLVQSHLSSDESKRDFLKCVRQIEASLRRKAFPTAHADTRLLDLALFLPLLTTDDSDQEESTVSLDLLVQSHRACLLVVHFYLPSIPQSSWSPHTTDVLSAIIKATREYYLAVYLVLTKDQILDKFNKHLGSLKTDQDGVIQLALKCMGLHQNSFDNPLSNESIEMERKDLDRIRLKMTPSLVTTSKDVTKTLTKFFGVWMMSTKEYSFLKSCHDSSFITPQIVTDNMITLFSTQSVLAMRELLIENMEGTTFSSKKRARDGEDEEEQGSKQAKLGADAPKPPLE